MTSIIKVDNLQNQCGANIISESSNVITIGASGDTVTLAAGASQSGFGRSGSVNWDTTPKTTGFTAVSGNGYFCNTTSAAFTVTLPLSPSAGAIVAIADYNGTAGTNAITVGRNSSNINGTASNFIVNINYASISFVYVDATAGWRSVDTSNKDNVFINNYVEATGGTISTCGDYKIHTFTGPGTFTVTSAGSPSGSTTVDYMVVAGGGGGAARHAGGGGAGGFRESVPSPAAWTASPLANPGGALPVSVTGYPITVGAGGAGATSSPTNTGPYTYGQDGNNSIFSTITSTGGGSSGGPAPSPNGQGAGKPGGSGGGASWSPTPQSAGTGNTPPVSPSQGNSGGTYTAPNNYIGSGGGGATAAGGGSPNNIGGAGATTSISGSPTAYAGGGGGGSYSNGTPDPAAPGAGGLGGGGQGSRGSNQSPTARVTNGTTNTGGGGGGGGAECTPGAFIQENGGSGGSGIVVIRYKFQ